MENASAPSRTKRKLALGLAAVVIVGVAACSHHHNDSTTVVNNTTNNMENNTTTENATAATFGSTFAGDFGANANSDPANVSANDITPVSPTTNPVTVNSTGVVNGAGN